jgi:hypothetical protein
MDEHPISDFGEPRCPPALTRLLLLSGMEIAMKQVRNAMAGSVSIALLLLGPEAFAASTCAGMALSCENGRAYPVCPIAVSIDGALVTGRLGLSPGRGVQIRLVPMGVGYRYVGRNIWFEGQQ